MGRGAVSKYKYRVGLIDGPDFVTNSESEAKKGNDVGLPIAYSMWTSYNDGCSYRQVTPWQTITLQHEETVTYYLWLIGKKAWQFSFSPIPAREAYAKGHFIIRVTEKLHERYYDDGSNNTRKEQLERKIFRPRRKQ